ncbi:MAG: hypothetical protein OQK04_14625, partial [Kangiellaceae bacterium]|nr:hypothetical protein [Kangiellaceae bacterium]
KTKLTEEVISINTPLKSTGNPSNVNDTYRSITREEASILLRDTSSPSASRTLLNPLLVNQNLSNEQKVELEKLSHLTGQMRKNLLEQHKLLPSDIYRQKLANIRTNFDKKLVSILTEKQHRQYLKNTTQLKEFREKHTHDHENPSVFQRSKTRTKSAHSNR